MRRNSTLILTIGIIGMIGITLPCVAETLNVSRVGHAYAVYNTKTGKTVYVKDVDAYVQSIYKSRRVEGFGKSMNQKTFQEGSHPVKDTAEAAVSAVGSVANTAYNTANMYPSWRRFTAPVNALFGEKSKQPQR